MAGIAIWGCGKYNMRKGAVVMIRRAEEKDISGILALLRQVLMVHHNGRPDIFKADSQKYSEGELQKILADDSRPVFVAVERGKVLGYAFCIFQQYCDHPIMTDIKTLYIDDLCVDEGARGKHIGTALYEYVLAFAKEQNCHNITLNVWAFNESARKFYEKLGLAPLKIGMEMRLK